MRLEERPDWRRRRRVPNWKAEEDRAVIADIRHGLGKRRLITAQLLNMVLSDRCLVVIGIRGRRPDLDQIRFERALKNTRDDLGVPGS